jgi:phage terminase large subunit
VARKQIELLPHQDDFIHAKAKLVLLLGGIGSGKSYAGSVFAVKESVEHPEIPGLITANTYRQLQNATLQTLFNFCDVNNILYDYNQNKGILNLCGCKWFTYSLDSYDNMRGIEVGKFWGDEMRDAAPEAFRVMLGRLRVGNNLKGRLTTTPSGYDYLYDYFAGDKKTDEMELIRATSMDNKFLPDGYVDTLRSSYDEKIYAQEVLGQFVNIQSGRIYYAFDRSKHVAKFERDMTMPLTIGMDFNISPMSASVCQVYGDSIKVIDEISINDSNTNQMAELIRQRYGTNLTIIPDATGKALKTSSRGFSDHEILRGYGFKVSSQGGNPFRADRYNTVNNLLEKGKVLISDRCVKLINDFERVCYKDGTNLPDTKDLSLTHASDSLGYVCWASFPILPRKSETKMIQR